MSRMATSEYRGVKRRAYANADTHIIHRLFPASKGWGIQRVAFGDAYMGHESCRRERDGMGKGKGLDAYLKGRR